MLASSTVVVAMVCSFKGGADIASVSERGRLKDFELAGCELREGVWMVGCLDARKQF